MTGAVQPSGMIFFVSTMEKLADNISRKQGIFPAPGQQRHRSTCLDSPSPSLQSVSTALKRDTWHHNAHSKSKEGHLCPQLPLQKKSLTKSLHKDSTEMVSNIFEYENCKAEVKDKVLNVKGRLRKHIDFWRNVLKARENVCNIIFSGYIVPFYELPESKYCKNNVCNCTFRFCKQKYSRIIAKWYCC